MSVFGIPEWALPVLAQGESVVPFTDIPDNFKTNPSETVRFLDVRKVDGPYTPADHFFTYKHYNQPEIDPARFRLKITVLVDRPLELSLGQLKSMGGYEVDAGFVM